MKAVRTRRSASLQRASHIFAERREGVCYSNAMEATEQDFGGPFDRSRHSTGSRRRAGLRAGADRRSTTRQTARWGPNGRDARSTGRQPRYRNRGRAGQAAGNGRRNGRRARRPPHYNGQGRRAGPRYGIGVNLALQDGLNEDRERVSRLQEDGVRRTDRR